MELVKDTIPLGNSAGILLPKEWLGRKVKVVLQSIDFEKEILDILREKNLLSYVLGVYLVGSYARNEGSINSDVDVLVVTKGLNKKINEANYDIVCITEEVLEDKLKNNCLPILPWIREAKVILNRNLINKYSKEKITKQNIEWHIKTTMDMMKKVKEDVDFSEKVGLKVSDASSYSLVLRLRTLYIIECLIKNRLWKKQVFLKMIKKIAGSLTAYEGYEESKNKNSNESRLEINEARRLLIYINEKIGEIERWLKEKKD